MRDSGAGPFWRACGYLGRGRLISLNDVLSFAASLSPIERFAVVHSCNTMCACSVPKMLGHGFHVLLPRDICKTAKFSPVFGMRKIRKCTVFNSSSLRTGLRQHPLRSSRFPHTPQSCAVIALCVHVDRSRHVRVVQMRLSCLPIRQSSALCCSGQRVALVDTAKDNSRDRSVC